MAETVWQCCERQLKGEFNMGFKKASLVTVLAASMASAPVLAQTAATPSAAPVTAESARAGADMDDANAQVRRGWFIPLLALLAIIAGILAATSSGGDRPTSP